MSQHWGMMTQPRDGFSLTETLLVDSLRGLVLTVLERGAEDRYAGIGAAGAARTGKGMGVGRGGQEHAVSGPAESMGNRWRI